MGLLIVIAIAAGAASALLAAGVAGGSLMAVPLFYLAPLPVMIAGMAFSPWTALGAVLIATVGLGLVFGRTLLLAYAVGMGAPAFGLSYAALLAREDKNARDGLLWFPVGTLVLMAAGFATLAVTVALLSMASGYEAYTSGVVAAVEALLSSPSAQPDAAANTDATATGTLIAHLLPPMAAVMSMVSQLVSLYLAGRAARVSDRLSRPWPDIAAFRLPQVTSILLAGALLLSLAPALIGLAASAAAATLIMAYALAGFALVHTLTRGHAARFLVLTGVWMTSLLLGWPLIAMAVLGFVDAMFNLRTRLASAKGPPAANDP